MARLTREGIGECAVRGELGHARRGAWFFDCGAFGDWRNGRTFNGLQFSRDLRKIAYWPMAKPDFIVLPDLVGQGLDSLTLSLDWLEETRAAGAPVYLAVQDGMTPANIAHVLDQVDGLFIGGTLPWKLASAAEWIAVAHARGLKVHIGRVGTVDRIAWAKAIDADSIDSCLPLWSTHHLEQFVTALARPVGRRQGSLSFDLHLECA